MGLLHSGKILPFIILVLIPLLISIGGIFIPGAGTIYAPTDLYFPTVILYFYIAVIYGVLAAIKYSPDKYFRIKGPENAIIEYSFIKKIVYIELPTVIFAYAIYLVIIFRGDIIPSPVTAGVIALNAFAGSLAGGVVRMIIQSRKIEFPFYFAKAILEIASREKEETKKAKYVIEGIKSYDRYLRRNLNLHINNIEEICSKLIIDSIIDKNEAIGSLSTAFESDNDKLTPAKCLSEITNVQETKKFLIEESIGQRIKDMAIFFATIIPVIITVIQLLLLLLARPVSQVSSP